MKPPRPADVAAQQAKAHRLAQLRRRASGYAIGFLLKPEHGVAFIAEPVTTESQLRAAVEEKCRRHQVPDLHAVDPTDGMRYLDKAVASVWWKRTVYGLKVLAGKAPRPRDLARRNR